MSYTNPADRSGDAQTAHQRRKLWVALGIALPLTLVCLVVACVVAFTTGGAVLILATRQHRQLLPMVGVQQGMPNATSTVEILPTAVSTATVGSVAPATTSIPSVTATPVQNYTSTVTPATIPEPTALISSGVDQSLTDQQLRIFSDLWTAVDTYYIYPDFNGLDWPAVRAQYELSITSGITNEAFYDLMREAVSSLNDDHSYFLSPEEARQEEEGYRGGGEYAGVGIITDFNLEKKYAFVLQVLPDSPALNAGIRAHDHILTIDGLPSIDAEGNPAMYLLRGTEGTTVTVSVRTPGQAARDLVLTRAKLSTSEPIEYYLLPGNQRIGYVLIPTLFEENIGERVRAALRELTRRGRLNGLIVDMRINGGGSYPILMQNLGFFTSGIVGYLADRQGERSALNVKAERISNMQTVPLAVLIGPSTQSYAEVYAGTLHAKKRAILVGQRSGGNIETLRSHDFEDGSEAWIAEETFKLPNGDNWEGKGLTPDVLIDQGWDEYTADNDPMIAAAVKAITGGR